MHSAVAILLNSIKTSYLRSICCGHSVNTFAFPLADSFSATGRHTWRVVT